MPMLQLYIIVNLNYCVTAVVHNHIYMLTVCIISLIIHMLYGMYVYRLYKHTDTCQSITCIVWIIQYTLTLTMIITHIMLSLITQHAMI